MFIPQTRSRTQLSKITFSGFSYGKQPFVDEFTVEIVTVMCTRVHFLCVLKAIIYVIILCSYHNVNYNQDDFDTHGHFYLYYYNLYGEYYMARI